MQALNKQKNELINDHWQFVNEDDSIDAIAPGNIVALSALSDDMLETFDFTQCALWVKLPEELERITPYLDKCQMLGVYFPLFKNGRGFSMARRLRDELGYEGHLRALGKVIPDQYPMLIECGFDSVALNETHDNAQVWRHTADMISARYQQDSKGDYASILKQRHQRMSPNS